MIGKGTNQMIDSLGRMTRAQRRPLAHMKQMGINIDYNYSAVLMKVVRSKSETRLLDEELYMESLCRDTRTDEELALEKSTLANSRRIMAKMVEQHKDMSRHLADFKRLRKEFDISIKLLEEDIKGIERERAKANIVHRQRFIQHTIRKGIATSLTNPGKTKIV